MGVAGIGDRLAAVSLGQHHHAASFGLEAVHIGIHPVCGRGAETSAGHAIRGLGRAGVIDRMILEVLGHLFTRIQHFVDFGVCNVTGHNQGTVQV